jgi:hypothetical protein
MVSASIRHGVCVNSRQRSRQFATLPPGYPTMRKGSVFTLPFRYDFLFYSDLRLASAQLCYVDLTRLIC